MASVVVNLLNTHLKNVIFLIVLNVHAKNQKVIFRLNKALALMALNLSL